jgi:hypothetical protein
MKTNNLSREKIIAMKTALCYGDSSTCGYNPLDGNQPLLKTLSFRSIFPVRYGKNVPRVPLNVSMDGTVQERFETSSV